MKMLPSFVCLTLDGGGTGGGDFHPSLCPTRAWGLVEALVLLKMANEILHFKRYIASYYLRRIEIKCG
jgi:hypothetical protein